MEIKPGDLIADISKENPFENCKLGRKQFAETLTNVLDLYPKGFVLAINNEWGTGKTTFLRMWQQYLENNTYKTIYFNAWENDFDHNPLVAIISELKELSNSSKDDFGSILSKASRLYKHILPGVLKAIANKYIGTELVAEMIAGAAAGATEIFEEEIKDYNAKKRTIKEFREELKKFVAETSGDKPLVFFIDELDRCRPDYAVELLEQVKHLFSVDGIIFVLSIDKAQLSHAIRGFYGSDRINAEEYLRRFIDLECSIPFPATEIFCQYLYDYYSFGDIFETPKRMQDSDFQNDKDRLLRMSTILLSKATLRQQEKIYGFTRLVVRSFGENRHVFPDVLFILVYMKTMKPELYNRIRTKAISLQELADEFENLIPDDSWDDSNVSSLSYCEAKLLHFYNNEQELRIRQTLVKRDAQGKLVEVIKTKFNTEYESLAINLNMVTVRSHVVNIKLSYLLDRINLLS